MASFEEVLRLVIESSGEEDVKGLADALKTAASGSDEASIKINAFVDQLTKLSDTSKKIDGYVAQKAALAETTQKLADAKTGLADLNSQFDRSDTSSSKVVAAFKKAESAVASLTSQQNLQQVAFTKTSNALQAAGVDTEHLDTAQRNIKESISAVAVQTQALTTGLKGVSTETANTAEKGEKAETVFGSLKTRMFELVSIAALLELAMRGIEFGTESLHSAEQVEASLSRVKALASGAAAEFEGMDEAVEKAAKDTNSTTEVASAGLAALAAQGLGAKGAIDALIPTLQLARIANIDVGAAAGLVAENLKAFDLPATDAQRVVDLLTAASHGAAGGLSSMSDSAAKLAPDAKALGLGFDDLVSILGLVESKGGDTGKAMKGLRTIFQDLGKPSSDLRGELLALGDGSNDFGKAIAALSSGTPRAQQALQTLGGPVRTLVELFGQAGPDALAKFKAALEAQQGAASKTVTALDTNLRGAFAKLSNAVDLVGEKLVAPILEPFRLEFEKLAAQVNTFSDSDDFKTLQGAVTEFATKAAKAIDDFIQGVHWSDLTKNGATAIKGLGDKLGGLADKISVTATSINKAFDTIGSAYHTLGAVIDGVVAGGSKLQEGLLDGTQAVAKLGGAGDATRTLLEPLRAAIESVGDEAGGNAGAHLEGLKDDVTDLAGVSEDAAVSTQKQADASESAAPKIEKHAEATDTLGDSLSILPNYLKEASGGVGDLTDASKIIVPYLARVSSEAIHLGEDALTPVKHALDDAIKGLADLQKSGTATPAQLATASEAVEALSKKLEGMKQSADTGADGVITAFTRLKISNQAGLTQFADDLQKAFNTIKAQGDTSAAGVADLQNAFLAYARARLAAVAQLDQGSRDSAKAELEQQASILGVKQSLQDLEKQSASSAASQVSDTQRATDALEKQKFAIQQVADADKLLGNSTEKTAEAAQKAADASKDFSERGREDLASVAALSAQAFQGMLAVSQAAADEFTKIGLDIGRSLQGGFGESAANIGGVRAALDAVQKATDLVTEKITNQRTTLQGQIADLNLLGTTAQSSQQAFSLSVDGTLDRLKQQSIAIEQGTYDAGLLGKEELTPLKAALDAAIARAQALKDAALAAKNQFDATAQSIQDALDEATGNTEAIEDRRHQQQLADLQAQAKAANQLGSAAYQQAVANEDALHDLKIKNIESEQKAANNSGGDTGGGSGGGGSSTGGGNSGGGSSDGGSSGGGIPTTTGQTVFRASVAQAGLTVVINNHGPQFGTGNASDYGEYITRLMIPYAQKIAARSK